MGGQDRTEHSYHSRLPQAGLLDSGHHARPPAPLAVALAIQPGLAAKPGLEDVSKIIGDGGPRAGREHVVEMCEDNGNTSA